MDIFICLFRVINWLIVVGLYILVVISKVFWFCFFKCRVNLVEVVVFFVFCKFVIRIIVGGCLVLVKGVLVFFIIWVSLLWIILMNCWFGFIFVNIFVFFVLVVIFVIKFFIICKFILVFNRV